MSLLDAVLKGDASGVEIALESGDSLEKRDADDSTMIHTAVEKGHEADINAKNKAGQTPLSIAATSGRLGVVSILLEAEAPVDVADEENDPLWHAVNSSHTEVVRMLLNHKAFPDIHSGSRPTPLCVASARGKVDIVRLLPEGAKTEVANRKQLGSLLYAAAAGHGDVVCELLKHKANVDMRNTRGQTALSSRHLAASWTLRRFCWKLAPKLICRMPNREPLCGMHVLADKPIPFTFFSSTRQTPTFTAWKD